MAHNTTPHLVADIERLRSFLGIGRWIVFGGSWGSTLALAYAEAHPERCRALALRGVFLCRPREIDWFLNGMRRFFPEAWDAFANAVPCAECGDLLAAYRRRLDDPDPVVHMPAARAWWRSAWRASRRIISPTGYFMPENALLDRGRGDSAASPASSCRGRYDMVCPIASAADLAAAWPDAETIVCEDSGHSSSEPDIRRNLVAVMDRLRGLA